MIRTSSCGGALTYIVDVGNCPTALLRINRSGLDWPGEDIRSWCPKGK